MVQEFKDNYRRMLLSGLRLRILSSTGQLGFIVRLTCLSVSLRRDGAPSKELYLLSVRFAVLRSIVQCIQARRPSSVNGRKKRGTRIVVEMHCREQTSLRYTRVLHFMN
jgi:hypothetical protein